MKLSMTSTSRKVIAILGAGPGLGLSIARRFGREGFAVALVSRTSARHPAYLQELEGIDAHAYAADVPDMLARNAGTILIPGGLSGKYPIPMLGALAPASAALRMYVLTLNEA